MNKWYRSAPVKGALLLIQQVLVVLAVVGLVWLSAYPGLAQDIVSGSEGGYSQSEGFGQRVYWDSQNIISAVADKENWMRQSSWTSRKCVRREPLPGKT